MASVLTAAQEQRQGPVQPDGGFPVKKRDIMRSANVNHNQLSNYLDKLESKGFIIRFEREDRLHLEITDSGEQLLDRTEALTDLLA